MRLAAQALEKLHSTGGISAGTRASFERRLPGSGDLTRAYATLHETGEPDQGLGYQNFLMGAACFVHWCAADLAGMAQAARQVVSNSAASDRAELVTFSHFHLGHYYYQRNDLTTAEKYLVPLVMQPYAVHAACFLSSAVVLARIRQTQGQSAEAQNIADLIASFALELRSEVVLFSARAFQAELALHQERLAEAGQWAEQYGSFRRVPSPYALVPPVVLALVLLKQDTPASRRQARQLLAQMDDYFTSIHYTVIRIQVLALQAMLHSAEGDERQALAALANSIALAAPGGFLRLFVDLGSPLRPLLRKLARRGVLPAYIDEILATFNPGEASPSVGQPFGTPPVLIAPSLTVLTTRELEVLKLLGKRYSDKEIADTLSISVDTVRSHVGISARTGRTTASHRGSGKSTGTAQLLRNSSLVPLVVSTGVR
jgi:LuxR family maltose regulon positive regulatory protein